MSFSLFYFSFLYCCSVIRNKHIQVLWGFRLLSHEQNRINEWRHLYREGGQYKNGFLRRKNCHECEARDTNTQGLWVLLNTQNTCLPSIASSDLTIEFYVINWNFHAKCSFSNLFLFAHTNDNERRIRNITYESIGEQCVYDCHMKICILINLLCAMLRLALLSKRSNLFQKLYIV